MKYESRRVNRSQEHGCDDVRQPALSHDSFPAALRSAANHDALRQPDGADSCQEATKTG